MFTVIRHQHTAWIPLGVLAFIFVQRESVCTWGERGREKNDTSGVNDSERCKFGMVCKCKNGKCETVIWQSEKLVCYQFCIWQNNSRDFRANRRGASDYGEREWTERAIFTLRIRAIKLNALTLALLTGSVRPNRSKTQRKKEWNKEEECGKRAEWMNGKYLTNPILKRLLSFGISTNCFILSIGIQWSQRILNDFSGSHSLPRSVARSFAWNSFVFHFLLFDVVSDLGHLYSHDLRHSKERGAREREFTIPKTLILSSFG